MSKPSDGQPERAPKETCKASLDRSAKSFVAGSKQKQKQKRATSWVETTAGQR